MLYPILGLIWLVIALSLLLSRQSLEAAGVSHPLRLAIAAGMLAAYDFFRWVMSRRARRRQTLPPSEKNEPREIVNPEFDFTDTPDKKT